MADKKDRDPRSSAEMPWTVPCAAEDLLPLARAIVSIMPKLRLQGYVPPPTEASVFFLYAACQGVSHYLAEEWPEALPRRMREAAYELAPEIARHLREFVVKHARPPGN